MVSGIVLNGTQRTIVKLLGEGNTQEAVAVKMSTEEKPVSVADVELYIKELCDLFGSDTPAGVVGKALAQKCLGIESIDPNPLSR